MMSWSLSEKLNYIVSFAFGQFLQIFLFSVMDVCGRSILSNESWMTRDCLRRGRFWGGLLFPVFYIVVLVPRNHIARSRSLLLLLHVRAANKKCCSE
jgi:hypothetical protein